MLNFQVLAALGQNHYDFDVASVAKIDATAQFYILRVARPLMRENCLHGTNWNKGRNLYHVNKASRPRYCKSYVPEVREQ